MFFFFFSKNDYLGDYWVLVFVSIVSITTAVQNLRSKIWNPTMFGQFTTSGVSGKLCISDFSLNYSFKNELIQVCKS